MVNKAIHDEQTFKEGDLKPPKVLQKASWSLCADWRSLVRAEIFGRAKYSGDGGGDS